MNRRFPDDATPGGTQTQVFSLRHAQPTDLVASLQSALAQGTVVVGDKRTGALVVTGSPPTLARARRLVAALDAPAFGIGGASSTATIQLHNLKAGEAVRALKGAVPDGALFSDERQNVVVVSGNSELQSTVRTLLSGLDAPGRQVMFEVRVADVEPINDTSNVGVQLGGQGYGSGALAQFPYTLTKSSIVVNAQLNALVQRGHASILAQPRVATLNNREASLLVGEQYPVVTVNQQTGYPTVQTIDVGVRLRLTPTIGADGSITADLHPEYCSDHRLQQQLSDRRQPQARRDPARARRRDHRAGRPLPRRRFGHRHQAAAAGRPAGAGRLLPQPPAQPQPRRGRLLHHPPHPHRRRPRPSRPDDYTALSAPSNRST